jgi:hypothetical protein
MPWNVEHTDEFAQWYHDLSEAQQDDLTAIALLLMEQGPQLSFPYSSGIKGSKHAHMRELRVQSRGDRCASSMRSIHGDRRSSSSAGRRPGKSGSIGA